MQEGGPGRDWVCACVCLKAPGGFGERQGGGKLGWGQAGRRAFRASKDWEDQGRAGGNHVGVENGQMSRGKDNGQTQVDGAGRGGSLPMVEVCPA